MTPSLKVVRALLLLASALSGLPSYGDTGTSVGDKGGEGAGPFGGLLQAPETSLFTGSLSQSIPILLPPGHKDATPDLSVSYSSSSPGTTSI
jgi:hypothetical protein